MTTRARRGDPETSHAAGAAVSALRASQARILSVFKAYGDLHDQALIRYVHDAERAMGFKRLMSLSGVRSRRSELCRPNGDRLAELRRQWFEERGLPVEPKPPQAQMDAADEWARRTLRLEGFRSPLWDTGRRALVDGRNVIIWGIAR